MSKKQVAPKVVAAPINPAPSMRILKVGSCKSLSAKSDLTYHIGHVVNGESKADDVSDYGIQFRVYANTGHGFWSDEWVPMSSIQEVFDKLPAGQPITSYMLYPLFRGKSLNSPGFMLAVLQHEGFVRHMMDKKRSYERIDPDGFMAEMVKLIDAGVDLRGDVKSATVKSASKKSKSTTVPVDASPVMPSDASPEQSENTPT